ncbi:TlpA family protein disulfide reductase [Pedobacter montanisoli]|uniref:TlpA family protein disulfide reductase n=1 Tax=Pedobacter montanisoli TaxID=2923277 RepID=A0ABS9ZUW6_9SPHI|nr:TlpA disulfide reductase family protein [Pedobacter montanisoli]MCJ0742212.1 TlpA family protein disulfide reductase [Pedobacter montanisoli]
MKINLKRIGIVFLLISCLLTFILTSSAQIPATLQINISQSGTDTLTIQLTQNSITRSYSKYDLLLEKNVLIRQWQIETPAWLYIKRGNQILSGLIEPEERLILDPDSFLISNIARAKFIVATNLSDFKNRLYQNKNAGLKAKIANAKISKYPLDYLFRFADSAMNANLALLQSQRHYMSEQAHTLLKADIMGTFMLLKYNIPSYIYHETNQQILATKKNILSPKTIKTIENNLTFYFDDSFSSSDRYAESVYTVLFKEYQSMVMNNNTHQLLDKYIFLNSLLSEKLKLPVLTLFLEGDLSRLNQGEDLEKIIAQTMKDKESTVYGRYIFQRVNNLFKQGISAPALALNDSKGNILKLSDLAGKVVLLDFWFKDCVPCHTLFQKLKPVKEYFKNYPEVVFLNVSIDSKQNWLEALQQFDIQGIHVYTQGLGTKHPIISDYKVAAYPTTTLIDKKGRIFMATPSDQPEELITQINAALKKE